MFDLLPTAFLSQILSSSLGSSSDHASHPYIYTDEMITLYTGCARSDLPYIRSAYLRLNYVDITTHNLNQKLNTYGDSDENIFLKKREVLYVY